MIRWLARGGCAWLLGMALAIPVASQAPTTGVEAVVLTVSDLDRSVAWFRDVLTFEKISEEEVAGAEHDRLAGVFGMRLRRARLRLGDERLELTEYLVPRGRPIPGDSASNDGWFQHVAIIVSDMDQAYRRLRSHRVEHASTGPQRLPDWNPQAGGIEAFYFRDPDHHVLEILRFPPGKGDPKWQRRDALFLGIDHTAIVVADTAASLRYYRDTLGLQVAGQSENYGIEQEHLNHVFGARLLITALRGAHGPGIELLEYLSPTTGRPMLADTRATDLWAWQTVLLTPDPSAAYTALRQARTAFVSPGVVELPASDQGAVKAMTVKDPDGHVLRLIEPRQ